MLFSKYKMLFFFKQLLNSAKTCFTPNHTDCASGNKESSFTLQKSKTVLHACDIRIEVAEVINISSSQLVSGDRIASAQLYYKLTDRNSLNVYFVNRSKEME